MWRLLHACCSLRLKPQVPQTTRRRALLAAGWLLGAAKRLPLHARRFRGPLPFVLRRWHAALAAVLGLKLLRAALRALRTLLFDGHLRHERARLQVLHWRGPASWRDRRPEPSLRRVAGPPKHSSLLLRPTPAGPAARRHVLRRVGDGGGAAGRAAGAHGRRRRLPTTGEPPQLPHCWVAWQRPSKCCPRCCRNLSRPGAGNKRGRC